MKGHENIRVSKGKNLFSMNPKPTDIYNYCKEKGHWKSRCPKTNEQQFGSVVAAEDETKSDDDIALLCMHTHSLLMCGLWIREHPTI